MTWTLILEHVDIDEHDLPALKRGRYFEERVERTPTCWFWRGTVNRLGYGMAHIDSKRVGAHRFAYELLVGPIPAGLTIDHVCHNGSGCSAGRACLHRRCVNPVHLEAVPSGVNVLRGDSLFAHQARQTHCLRNHAYDETNTYIHRGHRQCRRCRCEYQRALRASRRVAA